VKSDDRVLFAPGGPSSTTDIEHKLDWLFTFRGRLGYSFGRVLPYITGGLAYGQIESSAVAVLTGFGPPLDGTYTGSDRQRHLGWVAGGGMEFALSSNWSGRIEYLHVDLGQESYQALPAIDPVTRTHDASFDIVRAGINYRFGARY
jgi:outer membrane immunogenic protein